MPCQSANTLRASLTALVLVLVVSVRGAEKEKPASLVGLSVEQVSARLGDPRSQIKAGAREIMFFPKVKVTFRNGVVVETEELFDEPPPPPKRAPEAPAPAATAAGAADSPETTAARKTGTTPTASAGTATAETAALAGTATKPSDVPLESKPTAAPIAGLEIKSVRPPSSSKSPRPAPRPVTPTPVTTTLAAPAVMLPKALATTPTASQVVAPAAAAAPLKDPLAAVPTSNAPAAQAMESKVETKPDASTEPGDGPPAAGENEKPKVKPPSKRFFRRRAVDDADLPEASFITAQTYVFAATLVGAVGFLIWRARQRKLELAATTVSSTPFNEPAMVDNSALFTADLLSKLEWKHFEELVAAYYVKTGVVAVRTKTGPDSPVHLQISWKGESKPFACVQCHANPPGLIRAAPLQELHASLTAADIRRGYVVTSGKFNVEARDFAEEKHFTLLPGDLFLEKLNALPPAARAELMHQTTAGDYSTASCPKCEAKMLRTDDGGWRCAKCETTILRRSA